jgi:hypothetical protein
MMGFWKNQESKMDTERKFLHDISSPLSTLQLNLELVISVLGEEPVSDLPMCRTKLAKCMEQTQRIVELIRSRRDVLIASEGQK